MVLLPPSETKATRRRGAPIDWAGLSEDPRRPEDLLDLLAPAFDAELAPAGHPGRPRDLLVHSR